ncbi:proline hydroxylase [Streptomyces sp. NPDC013953]|uniref:2OG-Fe(II)-dependent halogenase WelO5 family protein n=1 Tax=Streptomyces sp. NPDC013953 TaxID=3364868 RepID=UPI003701EC4B
MSLTGAAQQGGPGPVSHDPLFRVEEAPVFTRRHLARLAAGTAGAVKVPRFFGPAECEQALASVRSLPLQQYDPARVPLSAYRFGPQLNEFRTPDGGLDAEAYWHAVEGAERACADAGLAGDPVSPVLERLGTQWETPLVRATIDGRPVFGGAVRAIENGTLVHCDELVREFPDGLFDQDVTAQLAFNLYAATPEKGGETVVWRRRWHPDDDSHRQDSGFKPSVVEGCQPIRFRPAVGAALLFHPGNMHAVEPSQGPRITFSLFLGLTVRGELIYWS